MGSWTFSVMVLVSSIAEAPMLATARRARARASAIGPLLLRALTRVLCVISESL
jgi:hypothetical protein